MFCVARTQSIFESASSENLVFIVHMVQEARLSEENLLCEIFLYLKISHCIVNNNYHNQHLIHKKGGTRIYTSYGGWLLYDICFWAPCFSTIFS